MLRAVPGWADELIATAAKCAEDIDAAIELAREFGTMLAMPGRGPATVERWAVLAALGRQNLTVARVFEAHTDALAIRAEAGESLSGESTWGVFAAETSSDRLVAEFGADATVRLTGVKPWCSLGHALDCALVAAHRPDGARQLFAVDLRQDGVEASPPQTWAARGLRTVGSGPVRFGGVAARAVGEPGWYLDRPGFAWGGMGVAAVWFGGALGLADTLRRAASARRGELNDLHVGVVDAALHAAGCVLAAAADTIGAGEADRAAGTLLALRVRQVVADAVEQVLRQVGHALGPAPLAFDAEHAARVADLQLYVRQHHGERDLAALGRCVLGDGT
jgi:hypothetical protein